MKQTARKAEIRHAMEQARERTLRLLDLVPEHYFNVRVHDFYSPIGWHFGHIGMTEEYWVCQQALALPCLDEDLSFLFANLPENPKDNRVHLPSRDAIKQYLFVTRCRSFELLETTDTADAAPLVSNGYAWEFALQHECQHQETIAELMQLIAQQRGPHSVLAPVEWPDPALTEMVGLPGGIFTMGSDAQHAYDNEKSAHSTRVRPFRMDRTPVTSAQWLVFLKDGGYARQELWTEAGWLWRQRENATCPEYWHPLVEGEAYACFGPLGLRNLDPEEPVSSISWFEAEAYARWAGKRLPTETEWEFAAAFEPETGASRRYPWGAQPPESVHACFGQERMTPCPVGQHRAGVSPCGLLDMAGNVWEWTATPFRPYPGFRAFPYDGYSRDHMDGNHFVCRGGSWSTSGGLLRCSFRNWYIPTYRQGFLGVRCAR